MTARQTDSRGLTPHASARMQQRGIPLAALECLLEFGREAHDHRGCTLLYFDKAARRRLARSVRFMAGEELPRVARTYAVVSECGEVVTVGHRFRRIRRG